MEVVIPLLLFLSHVVTFLLGFSFGARVWSFYHRDSGPSAR
jgi:hypothetical protein